MKGNLMPTDATKYRSDVVRIVHEPGNGTRYEAVGFRMPDAFPDKKGYWLVTFPTFGICYYFMERSHIAVSYVAEKLEHATNGLSIPETDLHEMTKLIARITKGRHDAATTKEGRLTNLRIAK
jgi:hypothetical protein